MAESVRKRKSKWDIPAEPQVPATIGHEDALPKNADDSANHCFSSENEANHFSVPFEMETDAGMMNQVGTEADDLTQWPQRENNSIEIHMDLSEDPQLSKASGMEVGKEDDSVQSYAPLSGEHAAAKEDLSRVRDEGDQTLKESCGTDLSSGCDAWKQLSPTVSPKRSMGTLDRSGRSRSRSWSRSRSRSRGRSWSRSRSQSPSYSYRRGPQRIRSRSPSSGSRRGPERWTERGRTGGGCLALCRDFAEGRCRRGSECRFRHEESERRQSGRYHDTAVIKTRESRFERGRHSASDSREQSDHSRDKFSRNDRPTVQCYDFTKGRCQRGSSCRYAHHEASSDGGWNMRDETREKSHDRRDGDPSYDRRLEPSRRMLGERPPCKFFAEGRCSRGESCRFSHQGVVPHDDRSGYTMGIDSSKSSWNSLNPGDRTAAVDTANSSQWTNNDDGLKVEGSGSKSQHSQSQANENIRHQNQPQEATNLLPVVSFTGQSIGQGFQNQNVVPQPLQTQMFVANTQTQQFVPPMPLNGLLQQAVYPLPQNLQNQFMVSPVPNFNASMQNLPVLPPPQIGQSQQNYNLLPLHNDLLPLHNGQNQQNYNISTQIQQNPALPPHHGLSQQNFSGQSHPTLPLHQDGQNQNLPLQPPSNSQSTNSNEQPVNPNGQQIPSTEPLKEQSSVQISDNLIIPKVVTSEQAAQITNLSASLARFFGSASALNPPVATGMMPVQSNQGPLIQQLPHPLSITMEPVKPDVNNFPPGFEQKDLTVKEIQMNANNSAPSTAACGFNDGNPPSKSVNNFPPGFEQNDLTGKEIQMNANNSSPSTAACGFNDGNPPSKSVNNFPPGFEQNDLTGKEVQMNANNSAPSTAACGFNDGNLSSKSVGMQEVQQGGGNNAPKEENKADSGQDKKEVAEDADADQRIDRESKQGKDTKVMRLFKSAIVDFVKDVLKPSWKEGHLSKEAHKTIVKKVVEKVTGAIQGPNIPQTQEKIDIYLSHSRVKLTKLVQAYVEKYVKS